MPRTALRPASPVARVSRVARVAAPLAVTFAAALALTGCADKPATTAGATVAGAGGAAAAITVDASDTACALSATTARAGTVTFHVTNTGSKVNEFYVYAAGDRVVAEAENITPGLSHDVKVELPEPGTYTTACKPGMAGDGIRATFTVTGAGSTTG